MDQPHKSSDDDRRIGMEARDWLVRLTSGTVSDADVAQFRSWAGRSGAHRAAIEREWTFWQQLHAVERSAGELPFTPAGRQASVRSVNRRRLIVAAGGFAGLAVAAPILVSHAELWWRADYATAVGAMAERMLPDGTSVLLNTDTAIAIDYRPGLRRVELLKGEAMFRVKPLQASRFRVTALGGNSDADDTSFSVQATAGLATITVASGSARVISPALPDALDDAASGGLELGPDQRTTYAKGGRPTPVAAADPEVDLAWRRGRIIFEGQPFAKAISQLGRYVPERIVVASSAHDAVPVTAIVKIPDALSAVEAIGRTQGLTMRHIPGLLVLLS